MLPLSNLTLPGVDIATPGDDRSRLRPGIVHIGVRGLFGDLVEHEPAGCFG